ncbi:quercetin dioxygenase-like cupin family protein [Methylohalomonas lacus]|uniref:Quercetin dioxygenase-like cupin family protein n=1 Tax=Methylohalomonas lacus TaxID=398773 RepID=A0AAE3HJQ3_9GAMM|nr:cupin domain-containing protein [Methylohalomonas lacus]MCS3902309.1 quercetin dioxygenase-like cupin family protein [Methylohalomonas lacus]
MLSTRSSTQGSALIMLLSVMLIATHVTAVHAAEYGSDIRIKPLLETDRTVVGQTLDFSELSTAEVRAVRVVIPPNTETGWHVHDIHAFAYVLSGTVTVEFENHERRTYTAGDALAEAINTPHNGFNHGDEDAVIVMFAVGEPGAPLSRMLEQRPD